VATLLRTPLYEDSKETLHPIRSGKAITPFTSDGGTTKGARVDVYSPENSAFRIKSSITKSGDEYREKHGRM
jgi:hypothetical protein